MKRTNFGDIFSTMEQEVDQFLKSKWPTLQEAFGFEPYSKVAFPKANIISNHEHFVMVFEVCGCNKEDVSVEIKDNFVIVSGKNTTYKNVIEDTLAIDDSYRELMTEIKGSEFKRTFRILDKGLDLSKVEAKFKDGYLFVVIRRFDLTKPSDTGGVKVTIQ